MAESSPYDAAIVDLEGRIQHLQTMLEGLIQLRAQAAGVPLPSTGAARSSSDSEIHHDTFFGMTIGDASKKFLVMAKSTKSTKEIAEALERGGLKHASKNFLTTVRSILGGRDDFTRVNGDWGLIEWYPGMRKERKEKKEKGTQATTSNTPAIKIPNSEKTDSEKEKVATAVNRKQRIIQVMASDPNKHWTAGDISKITGEKRKTVQVYMTAMTRSGNIMKSETGYSLKGSAIAA